MTDARSEPAGELLPGTSYRLIKRLGGGGMGSVYIAEHTALGRHDAVKLLAPHIAEDAQAMKRLEREARATAALANPHIIDIYTLGVTTDNRPYVAMRLIRGESLKELLERERKLDVDRAWALLRQVCLALQSAHEAGIVHRDLKPDNLMVEPRDAGEFVTILDFGIAKVEAETEARLTQDGQVIGTPGYMAPEQALGRAVDGRADQYSIAAIFYELVSGAFPYDRLGALQTITQQITQDPKPLSQHVGDQAVPPALQRLIMRSLSRDPADRLAGLDAFIRLADEALGFVPAGARSRLTLEAVRVAPAVPPGPVAPVPGGRRQGPLVIVGVAALGGAAMAAYLALGGSPTPGATESAPVPAVVEPAPGAGPPSRVVGVASSPVAAVAPSPSTVASSPATAGPSAEPALAAGSRSSSVPLPANPASARAVERRPASGPAPGTAAAAEPTPPSPAPPSGPPAPTSATPVSAAVATSPAPVTAAPAPRVSAAEPPRLVIDGLQIVGGGSGALIKPKFAAAEASMRGCVARTPGLAAGAAAKVKVVIDEDGFFDEPQVSGDAALGRCAAAAVKGFRLDRRPDTGGIVVTVPLRLEAP